MGKIKGQNLLSKGGYINHLGILRGKLGVLLWKIEIELQYLNLDFGTIFEI